MIRHFCRFCHTHHRAFLPLLRRLFDEGFSLAGQRAGERRVLNDSLNDLRDDLEQAVATLEGFSRDRDGLLSLMLDERTLVRIDYSLDWNFRVLLDLFDDNSADLAAVQTRLIDAFAGEDYETALDLGLAFLAQAREEDLHLNYRLETKKGPFLAAQYGDAVLRLDLVDLATYLFIVFRFMHKAAPTLLFRSPLDLLRLLEEFQDMIRYMAESLRDHELTMEIVVEKHTVFRSGHGVKAGFGGVFGPTAIQLEALTRILMSVMPRRGE